MASTLCWWRFLLLTASCGYVCLAELVVTYTETGVIAERRAARGQHLRFRREVNRNMTGFNNNEKMMMLRRHNNLRSTRSASDMMYMEWDDRLTNTAQKWAENCFFKHSTGRTSDDQDTGYRVVGENLHAGTHEFDPADVVQMWYDEIQYYNYQTRGCSGVCGHYTQVVWATSRAVGCGVKYCPVLRGSEEIRSGYHVVCHYGPGGNYVGERPYATGDPCSKCPITASFCIKGLCSKLPKIGGDGGQVVQSYPLVIFTALLAAAFLIGESPR